MEKIDSTQDEDSKTSGSVDKDIPVTGVSISETSFSLAKDETKTLTATITPSDAKNKKVFWVSSDPEIATIDENGKVTALSLGDVTITVTTEDGNKTATCALTVKGALPAPDIIGQIEQIEIKCKRKTFSENAENGTETNGEIYGKLSKPKGASAQNKVPLVIRGHGFNGRWNDTEIASIFAMKGIACYAFDFAGAAGGGLSTGVSASEYSVCTMKDDYKSIIAEFSDQKYDYIDGIYILGESQGGLVAALCAPEVASKIKGLLLIYPAFSIKDDVLTRDNVGENLENFPAAGYIDRFGLKVYKKYYEDLFNLTKEKTITQLCTQYKGPVMIIHGTEDIVVPIKYSRDIVEQYKDESSQKSATLYEIPGAGHGFSYGGFFRSVLWMTELIKGKAQENISVTKENAEKQILFSEITLTYTGSGDFNWIFYPQFGEWTIKDSSGATKTVKSADAWWGGQEGHTSEPVKIDGEYVARYSSASSATTPLFEPRETEKNYCVDIDLVNKNAWEWHGDGSANFTVKQSWISDNVKYGDGQAVWAVVSKSDETISIKIYIE